MRKYKPLKCLAITHTALTVAPDEIAGYAAVMLAICMPLSWTAACGEGSRIRRGGRR